MAKIAKQLTELIGNTPLLELTKFSESKGIQTPVIAKVEYFNPGGSVKDRIALAMIEDAEKLGADAVVGVRYGSSAVMQGAAEIIVYGTAVKLK